LKSWLDAGGAVQDVAKDVRTWLDNHATTEAAGFVLKSWLDAGGAVQDVAKDVRTWLDKHGSTEAARFVLKSWLDAGGAVQDVAKDVRTWLDNHASSEDATFVLKSWLESDGDFLFIKPDAFKWLSLHRESPRAGFITKFLARQPGLPIETVRDILVWCQSFPNDLDAVWRFSRLGKNVLHPELSIDVLRTAEVILPPIVFGGNDLPSQAPPTLTAFFFIIQLWGSDPVREKERVKIDSLFAEWFRLPGSFPKEGWTPFWLQSPKWILKVADVLRQGRLDVDNDRTGLTLFLWWINSWNPHKRALAGPAIRYLRRIYCDTDIWDTADVPPLWLKVVTSSRKDRYPG